MIVCANISCKWPNDSEEDENTGIKSLQIGRQQTVCY